MKFTPQSKKVLLSLRVRPKFHQLARRIDKRKESIAKLFEELIQKEKPRTNGTQ